MAKRIQTDTAVRTMSARARRRRPVARARPVPRWLLLDLLAVCCLAVPWLGIVGYVAVTPPTREAFAIAAAPERVIFRNFYGIEQNAGGQFRWGKPEASISLPVAAPADYAVALTLQDSPAAPPGRRTTVYINGQAVGEVALTTAPQAHRFIYGFTPALWSDKADGVLSLEVFTTAFVPPGDPRALGTIVTAVEVGALAGNTVDGPTLGVFALLALLALYGVLRLSGLRLFLAAGACVLPILGVGSIALRDRSAMLMALERQILHPHPASLLALVMVGVLAGCCIGVRLLPTTATPVAGAAGSPATAAQSAGVAARAWHWIGVGAITALGFGLRFARYDDLSLWLDETATLHFVRYPWPRLLGLEGAYDPHPPLYYAVVKIVTRVVPEIAAGRLVSVFAGAATIPIVYALAGRLTTRRAALVASLIFALAPLHIWYSQEARMYTSALLFVALSYLALIAFAQTRRIGWAALYGIAALLSIYMSYSSLYALVSQGLLLGLTTWRLRRASLPLWLALLGVGLGILPWLGIVSGTVDSLGQDRAWYLGVSPEKMLNVSLSAIGLKNRGSYFWGGEATAWERLPALLIILVAVLVATAIVGGVRLARSSFLGLPTIVGLCCGTIGTAAVISLISPGFADRTILAATIGWAIALAAAAFGRQHPHRLDILARGGVALSLMASLITIGAFTRGATKTDYRALARDAALATRYGTPLIAQYWLGTTINAYRPEVTPANLEIIGQQDAFWIAYLSDVDGPERELQRDGRGYERVFRLIPDKSLALDLYLRPGKLPPGATPLALPRPGTGQAPWHLPENARPAGAGEPPAITLIGNDPATAALPYAAGDLYLLEVQIGGGGEGFIALRCLDAAQATLFTSSVPAAATSASPRTARVATFCPVGSDTVQALLRAPQGGSATFSDLRLWRIPPAATAR